MILGKEITKRKSGGEKMKKQDKIAYEGMEGCQHEYADCMWP